MVQDWISEFKDVNEEQWKAQLIKELKGDDFKLMYQNEIEEISYSVYNHPDSFINIAPKENYLNISRGFFKTDICWRNGAEINVQNETEANKKALDLLMQGCNYLHFVSLGNTNWEKVLQGIGIEYIKSCFTIKNESEFIQLTNYLGKDKLKYCLFDIVENKWESNELKTLIKQIQIPVIQIDGFSINQCGANAIQELAFVAEQGHTAILNLLSLGLTIDEACACIHFRMGVGSSYLVEIAKFRALKILWANIVKQYHPEHHCSFNIQISAHIGWVNKSLKDPYTNLLRQTTEAMSAIIGGIDHLVVHPYDLESTQNESDFSQRMALNISNLLQEESYLSSVLDPMGGSYSIELLTKELAQKSWELFKKFDAISPSEKLFEWKKLIDYKVAQRIEYLKNQKSILIGVNKFPNPTKDEFEWNQPKSFMGMNYLRLENEML